MDDQSNSSSQEIEAPQAGDDVRDLWKTVAQLCDAVNPLAAMTLSPPEAGTIERSTGNVVLKLTTGNGGDGVEGFDPQWVQLNAFGQLAYAQVLMSTLTDTLPADAVVVNAP